MKTLASVSCSIVLIFMLAGCGASRQYAWLNQDFKVEHLGEEEAAKMINEARRGDHNAVIMLGGMAEQMSGAGGDMANLGAVIKDMIDGERSVDKLCDRMGPQGESLITQIINELSKLDVH